MMIIPVVVGLLLLPLVEGIDCKPGWKRHNCSCYWRSMFRESVAGAAAFCQFMGGRLATAEDEDENTFLKEYAAEGGADVYILGGVRIPQDGRVWRWQNSQPIEFTDWKDGEPQNSYNCLRMLKSAGYKWGVKICDAVSGTPWFFICESP